MSYPHTPGFAPTDTSIAAAKSMEPRAPSLKERVLEAIRRREMTSAEIADALGVPYESVQPRTSELRRLGLIEDSGRRGPSRGTKTPGIVWRAAPPPEPKTQGRLEL